MHTYVHTGTCMDIYIHMKIIMKNNNKIKKMFLQ